MAVVAIAVGLAAVISGWLFRSSEHHANRAAAQQPLPAEPRPATRGCARVVVDDWLVDGRVDRVYARQCYDDALTALRPRSPTDETGSAVDAIERARAEAWPQDREPRTALAGVSVASSRMLR